jgi:hypothetical protein
LEVNGERAGEVVFANRVFNEPMVRVLSELSYIRRFVRAVIRLVRCHLDQMVSDRFIAKTVLELIEKGRQWANLQSENFEPQPRFLWPQLPR